MTTWAIVRDSGGNVGPWKYCTTKKDVAPYLYIQMAIDKYGWDDVMPCIINSVGGYTSIKGMDILGIITCESVPNLGDLTRYIKNEPNFDCGWISPNGDTYTCGHYGHVNLAQDICEFIYKDSYKKYRLRSDMINAPDDYLIQIGWIKIDASRNHYGLPLEENIEAYKKLDKLQEKWSTKNVI